MESGWIGGWGNRCDNFDVQGAGEVQLLLVSYLSLFSSPARELGDVPPPRDHAGPPAGPLGTSFLRNPPGELGGGASRPGGSQYRHRNPRRGQQNHHPPRPGAAHLVAPLEPLCLLERFLQGIGEHGGALQDGTYLQAITTNAPTSCATSPPPCSSVSAASSRAPADPSTRRAGS